jgi:hypothetical protein
MWRSVIVLACFVVACGETESDGDGPSACRSLHDDAEIFYAPEHELPATIEGTLCAAEDYLALSFRGEVGDGRQEPIRVRILDGAGPYGVTLFGVDDDGEGLGPLRTDHETHSFSIDASADLFFAFRDAPVPDDRVVLKLEGPPGDVALEVARPSLAPLVVCSGSYDPIPAERPAVPLPMEASIELCNFRDSWSWTVDVTAGRPVTIHLENPEAIDVFDFGVYRSDVSDVQELPVSAGVTRTQLGLVAAHRATFTPAVAGGVTLYASFGVSRAERVRLRVEQP